MTLLSDITPRVTVGWTSYSGIVRHRACPQAWAYQQMWRLEKPSVDDPAPAKRFGTWWHALRAADAIERGQRAGSLRYAPEEIKCADDGPQVVVGQALDVRGAVLNAADKWAIDLPEAHGEAWLKYFGTADVGRMLRNLDIRWRKHHAEALKHQRPIGVEVEWKRQLPGSETMLVGYTDEVQHDDTRGLIVVVDHKTSKNLDATTAADDMMDSQLHLNVWGLKDRFTEWGVPTATAIAYDRVCSAPPTKPKLTTKGARSKTVTNYDLPTYLAFCQTETAQAAGYEPEQSEIERISTPAYLTKWFQRPITPVNRNMARAHLQAAIDSDQDSRRTVDRVLRRGEAPRNMTGAACTFCQFAKLCRAQMIGGVEGEYAVEEYGLRVRP